MAGALVIESARSGQRFVHDAPRDGGLEPRPDAASAFRLSCVWCYQGLARLVGAAKYPAHLRQARYGQLREPFDVAQFWLDGSLTIDAEQQVAFLRQVVERRLPYRPAHYDTLKSIILAETTPAYRLYAKTGWAARSKPGIGWYVGYVETGGDTWLFALNIDTRSAALFAG